MGAKGAYLTIVYVDDFNVCEKDSLDIVYSSSTQYTVII